MIIVTLKYRFVIVWLCPHIFFTLTSLTVIVVHQFIQNYIKSCTQTFLRDHSIYWLRPHENTFSSLRVRENNNNNTRRVVLPRVDFQFTSENYLGLYLLAIFIVATTCLNIHIIIYLDIHSHSFWGPLCKKYTVQT